MEARGTSTTRYEQTRLIRTVMVGRLAQRNEDSGFESPSQSQKYGV